MEKAHAAAVRTIKFWVIWPPCGRAAGRVSRKVGGDARGSQRSCVLPVTVYVHELPKSQKEHSQSSAPWRLLTHLGAAATRTPLR